MWLPLFAVILISGYIQVYSYEGYKVLRLWPETKDKHNTVEKYIEDFNLVTWRYAKKQGDHVDVVIPPEDVLNARIFFARNEIRSKVTIENVAKVLEEFKQANEKAASDTKDNYDNYHTLDEINAWVDSTAANCGTACEVINIGQSFEDRTLRVLKLTDGTPGKQKIWVDGGIHAREWISPATTMYIMEQVVADYLAGGSLVEWYDWYFLPVINVDGYSFTWTNTRLWRKSRQTWSNTTCTGTDINRNFDFQWMTVGASSNPCSETFAGWKPYSEPEAKAVADYVTANVADNGLLFFTTHSYGQLFMAPWGYTTARPPNYNALMAAGQVAVQALTAVHGTQYELGSASEILYQSSGTSRDWAAGVPEFPWVYTIELRDEGRYGFELPPDQIRPTVEETWAGFSALISYIHDLPKDK